MSLQKFLSVRAGCCRRQYTAAQIKKCRGVVFTSDGRQSKEIDALHATKHSKNPKGCNFTKSGFWITVQRTRIIIERRFWRPRVLSHLSIATNSGYVSSGKKTCSKMRSHKMKTHDINESILLAQGFRLWFNLFQNILR